MEPRNAGVDYVRLLRRVVAHRWRIILTVFALVAVPTIVWTLVMVKNTYEASATLFLMPESSESPAVREYLRSDVHALYHVMLRSRSLTQAVVDALPKESRDELSRHMGFQDYVLLA